MSKLVTALFTLSLPPDAIITTDRVLGEVKGAMRGRQCVETIISLQDLPLLEFAALNPDPKTNNQAFSYNVLGSAILFSHTFLEKFYTCMSPRCCACCRKKLQAAFSRHAGHIS